MERVLLSAEDGYTDILWHDTMCLFQALASECGVQQDELASITSDTPTYAVLANRPKYPDDYRLQLWWSHTVVRDEIIIKYIDPFPDVSSPDDDNQTYYLVRNNYTGTTRLQDTTTKQHVEERQACNILDDIRQALWDADWSQAAAASATVRI